MKLKKEYGDKAFRNDERSRPTMYEALTLQMLVIRRKYSSLKKRSRNSEIELKQIPGKVPGKTNTG